MSSNKKIRAVFLDRDDTIVDDPGYITKPGQVKLLPGAGAALRRLRLLGYKLFIVTNQSGVARGMVTEEDLTKIHEKLLSLLSNEGVNIEKIYYCPFHPEGIIEEYKKESYLRKPNPGMLFTARDEMEIDLANSWMIGDSFRDIRAGKAAGCRSILINPPLNPRKREPDDPIADFEAVNITEAANIVKMFHQQQLEDENPKNTQASSKASSARRMALNSAKQQAEIPDSAETVKLLKSIHQAIVSLSEDKNFEQFSKLKFVCGIFTALAALSLLIAIVTLASSDAGDFSVIKPLGFAVAFQLMGIMLYIVKNDSR